MFGAMMDDLACSYASTTRSLFNPGIKGWVPADKSALISKGSQHLLFKRCVGPYPTLLNRRCSDLLCLDSMGIFPDVVHWHAERRVFVLPFSFCLHTRVVVGGFVAVFKELRKADGRWGGLAGPAAHRVWWLSVLLLKSGVCVWEGQVGRRMN